MLDFGSSLHSGKTLRGGAADPMPNPTPLSKLGTVSADNGSIGPSPRVKVNWLF